MKTGWDMDDSPLSNVNLSCHLCSRDDFETSHFCSDTRYSLFSLMLPLSHDVFSLTAYFVIFRIYTREAIVDAGIKTMHRDHFFPLRKSGARTVVL